MESVKKTKILYEIFKDELFLGYLVGSLHGQLNPTDYNNLKDKLEPMIDNCSTVYLECSLPHHSALPFGYEKAILEILEESENKAQKKCLESKNFQIAMLSSSIWLGTKIRFMPWHNYQSLQAHPHIYLLLSKIVAKFFWLANVCYNIVKNQAHNVAVQEFNIDQQRKLIKLYKNFQNNEVEELDDFGKKMFLMKDRDKNIADKIYNNLNFSNPTAYVVGALHLPGNNGIVKRLEDKGITLK